MGKILLVEPQSILRQAISLFLSPEYEVQVKAAMSAAEAGSLQGCELLIVDAAALRETDQLSSELVRAIQICKIPTLWLQENDATPAPERDKLATVEKPIQREALRSAVADLMSHQAPVTGASANKKLRNKSNESRTEPTSQADHGVIELVDVVEEEPSAPEQEKRVPGKSK